MNSEFKKTLPKFKGCDVFLFTYNKHQLQSFLKTHKTELTFIRNSLIKQSPELYDFEPKGFQNFILLLIKNANLIGTISAYRSHKYGNWIHFVWSSPTNRNQGFGTYMIEKMEEYIIKEYNELLEYGKIAAITEISNNSKFKLNVKAIPIACKFYEKNDYTFEKMLPVNEFKIVNSIYFKELPL